MGLGAGVLFGFSLGGVGTTGLGAGILLTGSIGTLGRGGIFRLTFLMAPLGRIICFIIITRWLYFPRGRQFGRRASLTRLVQLA